MLHFQNLKSHSSLQNQAEPVSIKLLIILLLMFPVPYRYGYLTVKHDGAYNNYTTAAEAWQARPNVFCFLPPKESVKARFKKTSVSW